MNSKLKLLPIVGALVLAGCTTTQMNQKESESLGTKSRGALQNVATIDDFNKVTEVHKTVVPMLSIKDESSNIWLTNKRVSLRNPERKALKMPDVIKSFFDQGINVSTSIPLDQYTYNGLGVNDTDAETALRSILDAVGLDYELDGPSETVTIRPMSSKSWKINLGDRKTSFGSNSGNSGGADGSTSQLGSNSNSSGSNSSSQSSFGSTGGQSGTTGQTGSTGVGQSTGGQGSSVGSISGNSSGDGATIYTNDDFWASLRTELTDRMVVLLPNVATAAKTQALPGSTQQPDVVVPAPEMLERQGPGLMQGGNSATQVADHYSKKRVGTFSINPVTGYVTVQAPRWLLNDLDKYMQRIQAEYSYLITFVGEMVLVTTTDNNSEGLDISSFGKFAQGRYGVGYSNNALGGVTVNFPGSGNNIPSISANGTAVANTLLGIRSPLDGLQVFNAYLQNYGTVNIIQKPIVATSNGVPGYFSRTSRKYFVQYSQTAASSTSGSAAVGTQNQLIPFDFGTTLTIYPRYDSEAGVVRADIILDQVVQSGTQNIPQQVTAGQNIQQVNQDVPLPSTFKYRGEVPLRDGDLIVIGGQAEDETNSSDAGVTGLKNGPLGGVFGQKNSVKSAGTYYFALRVKMTKRD